jgi:membrane protease YdiL (CAAX protease family)
MNDPPQLASLALPAALLMASATAWLFAVVRRASGQPIVPAEPRGRAPWSGWDVLLLFCATQGAQIIVLALTELSQLDVSLGLRISMAKNAELLATCGVLWMLRARGISGLELGWNDRRLAYDVGLGVAAFAAVAAPVLFLQAWMQHLLPSQHPIVEVLVSAAAEDRLFLLVQLTIAAVIIAPVCEEILFRVLLQGFLEAREQRWRRLGLRAWPRGLVPVLVSSAAFALMHLGHGLDPIPLFVLALVLGYLYFKTHRLLPSLVVHMALNALAMAQLWSLDAGGPSLP